VDIAEYEALMLETERVGGNIADITLHARKWAQHFEHDKDVRYLVQLAATGASWVYREAPSEEWFAVPNYVPDDHWDKVNDNVQAEREAGRIVAVSKDKVVGLIAIGVVDKDHSGFVKVRIVSDYSRPHGTSLNDCIEIGKDKFETVRSAYPFLRPYHFMMKVDLSAAYRSVPVARVHWQHQAFEWDREVFGAQGDTGRSQSGGGADQRGPRSCASRYEKQVYMDLRLPFGNKAAPGIFHRITMAVQRYMRSRGFPATVGYLDDFWLCAATKEECQRGFDMLVALLRDLGFVVNELKCVRPCQSLVFLGIAISTNADGKGKCTAQLDPDKVERVLDQCTGLQRAEGQSFSAKEVERTLGLLVFCSQVVEGSSLYLR
jgi:hypothetical protein